MVETKEELSFLEGLGAPETRYEVAPEESLWRIRFRGRRAGGGGGGRAGGRAARAPPPPPPEEATGNNTLTPMHCSL